MSELKDHKFIVFCGDNYNALGICRSLGEKGLVPIVVMYSHHPYLVNHCRYVKHFYRVNSPEEGLDFITQTWGDEPEKPFIYTMDDYTTMLMDQRYNELVDHFYFFNCAKQGRLTFYQDKKNICDLAEKCGIPQPKGEVLKKGELPQTLRYPVITKVTMSIKGAWKDDMYICQNEDELKEAYKYIVAEELLVQEFIEKKNELCVDGFSINGGEEVIFPYTSEYLRIINRSYGNYMLMKPLVDEATREKIRNIIKQCHYSGIFELESLIDKHDNLWILEVNFRNSTWSYAGTYGGINFPYYWAKWTLEGKANLSECSIRQEPFTAMAELSDLSDIAHLPDVSFKTWWKQFRECECTYIYSKTDRWPFYHAMWYKVKTAIKHKIQSKFGKYTYHK